MRLLKSLADRRRIGVGRFGRHALRFGQQPSQHGHARPPGTQATDFVIECRHLCHLVGRGPGRLSKIRRAWKNRHQTPSAPSASRS